MAFELSLIHRAGASFVNLLLMFDSASRYFDELITAKIIPMIENEKLRFIASSD